MCVFCQSMCASFAGLPDRETSNDQAADLVPGDRFNQGKKGFALDTTLFHGRRACMYKGVV